MFNNKLCNCTRIEMYKFCNERLDRELSEYKIKYPQHCQQFAEWVEEIKNNRINNTVPEGLERIWYGPDSICPMF